MSQMRLQGESPTPQQESILFLGKRFYTNKDALAERFGRIYQLPSLWAAQGSRVLLWLVDYHGKQNVLEQHGSLQIQSTPVPGWSVPKALAAAWRFRPDVVVASGDSYIGFAGWLIARLCGARFVFDIYDKYDEFAGYRSVCGFDLFRFLRKRADLTLYCSRALKDAYSQEGSGPGVIVANGVDGELFAPRDKLASRRLLGLAAAEVLVGYFGSMEPDRGVEDLLRALQILRETGEPVRLLICGKVNPAIPLDQDWVIFRGTIPHAEMPNYLNASDVLVIPYRQSAIMDMGASCKIAEYLMCERPIVSTSTGNFVGNFPLQARELGQDICPPGDVAALAQAIRRQLANPRILSPPTDMSWRQIADSALSAMRTSLENSK